jgi:hypothetical protein
MAFRFWTSRMRAMCASFSGSLEHWSYQWPDQMTSPNESPPKIQKVLACPEVSVNCGSRSVVAILAR